jgi:hypothetical protein
MRRRRLRLCADSINRRTQEKTRKDVRELRLRTVRYDLLHGCCCYCSASSRAVPRSAMWYRVLPRRVATQERCHCHCQPP